MASPRLFPHADHDHAKCQNRMMQFAEQHCSQHGLRLTRLRRDVLGVVAARHKAVGAYQILEVLAERGETVSPISVYRCLEFLQEAGLIHKLESTNAYFACQHILSTDASRDCSSGCVVLLHCQTCGAVGEMDGSALGGLVTEIAESGEFQVQSTQVEIAGLCQLCQNDGADAGGPC